MSYKNINIINIIALSELYYQDFNKFKNTTSIINNTNNFYEFKRSLIILNIYHDFFFCFNNESWVKHVVLAPYGLIQVLQIVLHNFVI